MLTALGRRVERLALDASPWTNVYGLARTALALASAATLTFSSMATLFTSPHAAAPEPVCMGVAKVGFFCATRPLPLEVARWLAVALLLVVATGYRPRLTALVHAWVTFGMSTNGMTTNGGDTIAAALSLLLLPVALTDPRRWHWDPPPPARGGVGALAARALAASARAAIVLQVSIIYLGAAVVKLPLSEWMSGTALYYWLLDPKIGCPDWLRPAVTALADNGALLALLTWSVLVLELLLAAAVVMAPERRVKLLPFGLALHAGIGLLHGLPTFALTMMAALVLFLWPPNATLAWSALRRAAPSRDAVTRRLSSVMVSPDA